MDSGKPDTADVVPRIPASRQPAIPIPASGAPDSRADRDPAGGDRSGRWDHAVLAPDASVPNIRRLRAGGASGVLRSTVPPITAAAWPSMLTGWNPGRHGMFDFRVIDITRPSSLWGAGQSVGFTEPQLCHLAAVGRRGRLGRRWISCALMTIPMTYPCWPVNGIMVAGFPLPKYDRNHTYPKAAGDALPGSWTTARKSRNCRTARSPSAARA